MLLMSVLAGLSASLLFMDHIFLSVYMPNNLLGYQILSNGFGRAWIFLFLLSCVLRVCWQESCLLESFTVF